MAAPVPQTKANDISNKFIAYSKQPFKKLDKGNILGKILQKEIKELRNVDLAQGYFFQGILHGFKHEFTLMKDSFDIARNHGQNYYSIFFAHLGCLKYNGLYYQAIDKLKNFKFDISSADKQDLYLYTVQLSYFCMNQTLSSLSEQLKKSEIKINNIYKNIDYFIKNTSELEESITTLIFAEMYTYLFQKRAYINDSAYKYDEELQINFFNMNVDFFDENGEYIEFDQDNFIDFDIEFQRHLINFAEKENLNIDNLIITLIPNEFDSDSELSE
ncbi:hypothetical protein CPT77_02750 [Snodgrassella alvi]|uniref:hypothetical protein n=1 Tax=Snodgrassella alvi TaxID=1196083 RepID=UPI000BBDC625|nr:hypothetical protein [Snodgrassella alvi]PCL21277.1 hypothetical protein CPT77_02750 [Snodgrassella alvi]